MYPISICITWSANESIHSMCLQLWKMIVLVAAIYWIILCAALNKNLWPFASLLYIYFLSATFYLYLMMLLLLLQCVSSPLYMPISQFNETLTYFSRREEREREALCAFFPLIPLCADLYLQCVAFGLNRRWTLEKRFGNLLICNCISQKHFEFN